MNAMDFDQILIKCGDFNRYQFIILTLFGFVNIITAIHYFSQTVIGLVPDHWCHHDGLSATSFEEIKAIYANYTQPSCTRLEWIQNDWTPSSQQCDRWIYDYDYGYSSMSTELNWVCDAAYKTRVGQSFFFVGSLVGTLFFGMLSDKFGRLPILIVANLCACIGDFLTAFTTTLPMFSIWRFTSGLAADANYYLMQILVLEYISPSKRSMCINASSGIFFTIGLVSTPWLAVWLGDWKRFLVGTTLPVLLIVLYYFVIQESAQWLITRNDIDGAVRRLECVARINKRKVEPSDFLKFRKFCEQQHEEAQQNNKAQEVQLLDMFKTPRMRKITLILFFKSIVITLCYDAVARNVEGMGISPLLLMSLNGLMLIPSSVLLLLLQDRIGRKLCSSGSMCFAGIFTIASGLVIAYQKHTSYNGLLVCLSLAARFGVGISYGSGALYATELIPTCVRGRGVAAVHVAGFAASFLSPYILLLGHYMKFAPPLIVGSLFFMGSFVCLLLPETLNKTLPKSIEEGELFGKGERMFDFPFMNKSNNKSTTGKKGKDNDESSSSSSSSLDTITVSKQQNDPLMLELNT